MISEALIQAILHTTRLRKPNVEILIKTLGTDNMDDVQFIDRLIEIYKIIYPLNLGERSQYLKRILVERSNLDPEFTFEFNVFISIGFAFDRLSYYNPNTLARKLNDALEEAIYLGDKITRSISVVIDGIPIKGHIIAARYSSIGLYIEFYDGTRKHIIRFTDAEIKVNQQ